MKLTINDIGGKIAKSNDTYVVKDNTVLNNLVVSSTLLYPGKETTGHSHEGQEEVYIFVKGTGKMLLRYPDEGQGETEDLFDVEPNDLVTIEDGAFHRVYNTGKEDLYFVCVFDGARKH